jgi:hypothetical protein
VTPDRCAHLTVDEPNVPQACAGDVTRRCLVCGVSYDRFDRVLLPLERAIRDRHRLPSSPWTAEERGNDLW